VEGVLPGHLTTSRAIPAALTAVLALLVVHAAFSGCDHDEIEHLHAAWLVSQGQRPFTDFLEQHHPTVWYLLACFVRFFEDRPRQFVFAARCIDLVLAAATVAAFTAMARKLLRGPASIWPALLLAGCFFFLRDAMEVRPDPWTAALAAIALWQWTTFLRGGSLGNAAWAGLTSGGSIAFLQKGIPYVGLLGLGTALVLGRDRRRWISAAPPAALFVACAAVPLAALALWEWHAGTFRDFWFWNYTYNAFYYLHTSFPGPSAWSTIGVAVAEDPLLWGAALFGLGSALIRPLRAEPEIVLSTAVVCGMMAAFFRSRWPFGHNLLLVHVPLALLAVRPVESALLSPRLRGAVLALLALLLLKVAVLSFVYDENVGSDAIRRKVLDSTTPADRVAVTPPYHPVFRRDAFFFWYGEQYNFAAYEALCRERRCPEPKSETDLRAWTVDPPRVVYCPPGHPDKTPPGFTEHEPEYRSIAAGFWERSATSGRRGLR